MYYNNQYNNNNNTNNNNTMYNNNNNINPHQVLPYQENIVSLNNINNNNTNTQQNNNNNTTNNKPTYATAKFTCHEHAAIVIKLIELGYGRGPQSSISPGKDQHDKKISIPGSNTQNISVVNIANNIRNFHDNLVGLEIYQYARFNTETHDIIRYIVEKHDLVYTQYLLTLKEQLKQQQLV
eukprot:UN06250